MAIRRNMARKRSEHYVNNKEFLAALVKYREDVEITYIRKFGEPPNKEGRASSWDTKPVIPRYIGECFLKIANHLSFKPNFVNYMFKEDMISCLLYTSDAADEGLGVDLGGRRIIKNFLVTRLLNNLILNL